MNAADVVKTVLHQCVGNVRFWRISVMVWRKIPSLKVKEVRGSKQSGS